MHVKEWRREGEEKRGTRRGTSKPTRKRRTSCSATSCILIPRAGGGVLGPGRANTGVIRIDVHVVMAGSRWRNQGTAYGMQAWPDVVQGRGDRFGMPPSISNSRTTADPSDLPELG